jgi:hypothetical protein
MPTPCSLGGGLVDGDAMMYLFIVEQEATKAMSVDSNPAPIDTSSLAASVATFWHYLLLQGGPTNTD